METISVAANTAEPKPDYLTIVGFPEAEYYLTEILRDFDKDPMFAGAVLQLLIADAMAYADDWTQSQFLDTAVNSIEQAVPSQEYAFEIARNASDLINQQLINNLQNFTSERFSGKYTYEFIGGLNGKIRVDYWSAGVPASKRRPAGDAEIELPRGTLSA